MKTSPRAAARVIAWPALTLCAAVTAAPDPKDPVQFFVLDRLAYDDNLFRIADGGPERPGRSADDYANRVSAGAAAYLDWSRQVLRGDVRVDNVRYQNNDDLDYTGGKANLVWDWELGTRWTGKLSGQYERAQASWSNYEFLARDIVDASSYEAEVRYLVGTHWRLVAAAGIMDTDHSAQDRRVDNLDSDSGRAAVEYWTTGGSVVGLDYRNTRAELPVAALLTGVSTEYEDSLPGVSLLYAFSPLTSVYLRAGYLERTYENPDAAEYSSAIWNALFRWEPRNSLLVELNGWRALRAYTDAESDYFVASGGSLGPTWRPTPKWKVAAVLAIEDQSYSGVGKPSLIADRGRKDDVQWAELGIEYTPRPIVSIGLLYRYTERDSNRELRAYDNSFVSVELRINL